METGSGWVSEEIKKRVSLAKTKYVAPSSGGAGIGDLWDVQVQLRKRSL